MFRCLLIGLLVSTAWAEDAPVIDARLAWDGVIKVGAATEVGIELRSSQDEDVSIVIETGHSQLQFHSETLSPSGLFVQLPLPPIKSDALSLVTRFSSSVTVKTELKPRFVPVDISLVAVLGLATNQFADQGDYQIIYPRIASLPHFQSSYGVVDAVVIDMDSIRALSGTQLSALNAFVSSCGRFIGLGITRLTREAISSRAGCHGRFVRFEDRADSIAHQVTDLLAESPPALISSDALSSLLPPALPSSAGPIAIFFAAYFVIMVFVAFVKRHAGFTTMLIPLLASVLVVMAWKTDRTEKRLISWAEFQGNSNYGQYTAILQVIGNGKGKASIAFPAHIGLSTQIDHSTLGFSQGPDDQLSQTVSLETRLLSREVLYMNGIATKRIGLVLRLNDEQISIENQGSNDSAPALLAWQDAKFTVPALKPDAIWLPESQGEAWTDKRVEKLFRERALRYNAALLVADSFFPAGIEAEQASAYLVLRL